MYGSDALLQMLHFMAAVGLNEMLVDVAMVIPADPIRLVSFSVAVWTLALRGNGPNHKSGTNAAIDIATELAHVSLLG